MRLVTRLVAVFVFTTSFVPAAFAQYSVTDIGTIGGPASWGRAINASGVVVGYASFNAPNVHAFRFDGLIHDLGTLGGANSYAYGINNAGVIVGAAQDASTGNPQRAFRYSGGVMTDLGDLGGPTASANAIDQAGDIAGYADTNPNFGNPHGFLLTGGIMNDLTTLGGTFSVALALNDSLRVAGSAALAGNAVNHASRWTAGAILDLGTLGGTRSSATAINNAGTIAGYSNYLGGNAHDHAFVRPAVGNPLDLGTLGGSDSQAWGINRFGQIVGWSSMPGDLVHHAFMSNGALMIDLNSMIPVGSNWVLNEAYGINDAGQICGTGVHNGIIRAFLLTPATLAVGPAAAKDVSFAGAYPNPVRGHADFAFTLPAPGRVRLVLYDVNGRAVRTLEDGLRAAGRHDLAWDATDDAGAPVAAGLYFARLELDGRGAAARRVSVIR